ncbi:hypothetical protein [Variovorax sp. E3]|uniref:hypothetical protein n=1 Tax=Variovorax sp. E3 TaxID=1914993 RepID=UPI0018DE4661|nr:hypothetical protein [Variovorax sp. E3]
MLAKAKLLALASLALLAPWSHAQQAPAAKNECPADAPFLSAEALKKAGGLELPVFKRYCYTDKSGSYALLLGEKQDLPFPGKSCPPSSRRRSTRWKAARRSRGNGRSATSPARTRAASTSAPS